MAKSFLVPINLNQLELQNARIQNLASAPASPVKGQVYFNTTTNKAMVYDGTNWIPWEADTNTVTGVKGNSESNYRTGNVNITAANVGAAPTSHASSATTYGQGTNSNYGHVKLSDSTSSTTAASSGGTAATPKAVKDALDAAKAYADSLDTGVSDVKVNGTSVVTSGVATLGEAAGKAVDTSISSGSSSINLPTTGAVASFVSSQIGAVDAMRFKGTIGTGGTITSLPTTGVKVGDTYRVITAGTYAGNVCEVGDLIIATATTPTWTVAQTNIDGAITSISGTSPISVTGSGSSRTVAISAASGTAAGSMSSSHYTKLEGIESGAQVNRTYTSVTGKPTGNQTPSFGGTFTISQISQSTTGQITATDRTVTIPDTTANSNGAGLMSASSYNELSWIAGRLANYEHQFISIQPNASSVVLEQQKVLSYLAYLQDIEANSSEEVIIDCTYNDVTDTTTFSVANTVPSGKIILIYYDYI